MANQIDNEPAFTVHRAMGNVVLTMTAQQAQLVAASIWPEDAERMDWLDTLPDMLRAAADGSASPAHSPNSDFRQQAQTALVENIARIRLSGLDSASPYNYTMEHAQAAALAHPARFRHNGFDSSYSAPTTVRAVVRSAAQVGITYAEALADDIEVRPSAPEQVAAIAMTTLLAAVTAAASRTYEAAQAVRASQAAITARTAQATAATIRRTAYLLQLHTDERTHGTANAATEAASVVAAAVLRGTKAVSAENARALAATIRASATAKAENTDLASATVARAAETPAPVPTFATPRADK